MYVCFTGQYQRVKENLVKHLKGVFYTSRIFFVASPAAGTAKDKLKLFICMCYVCVCVCAIVCDHKSGKLLPPEFIDNLM